MTQPGIVGAIIRRETMEGKDIFLRLGRHSWLNNSSTPIIYREEVMLGAAPCAIRIRKICRFAAVLMSISLAVPAWAETLVFDHSFAPNAINYGSYSDRETPYRVADLFSFSSAGWLNTVSFLGAYAPNSTPQTDSFTLTIYNMSKFRPIPDSASVVAQVALTNVGRFDTGTDISGNRLFQYTANFTTIPVAANKNYWLTIVNNTTSDPNDNWVWAGNRNFGNSCSSTNGGASWYGPIMGSHSFRLEGVAVPEPASVCMCILGGLLLVSTRRLDQYTRGN
jgi:hypothetical protein